MKKILLLIFITHFIPCSFAQMVTKYEYWFDQNYGSKIIADISSVPSYSFNQSVSTTGLTEGLHELNIRFADDSLKWSEVVSSYFFKNTQTSVSKTIIAYEYWFDSDFSNTISQSIAPQSLLTLNTMLSTASLNDGLHVFHIRFKDSQGEWTAIQSQYFIRDTQTTVVKTICAYEYWFDSDFSNTNIQYITPQHQLSLNTLLSTAPLNDGLHVLHVRFKDSQGEWTTIQSQYFIRNTHAIITKTINTYEYWFDNDYSNTVSETILPQHDFSLSTTINVSSLPDGLHFIHFRMRDNEGNWSSPTTDFFLKKPAEITSQNTIIAYRSWIDNNSVINTTILPSPTFDYLLMGTVSLTQIQHGWHLFHFQFLDSYGKWSSVTTDSVYKNPLPIAFFTANQTIFCDSGTVSLTSQVIDATTFFWDFGDGNFSTDSNVIHTYTSPGIYSVSLTVTDTISALDSTYTLDITINSSTSNTITTSACNNFTLNGQTYFSSGTFNQTLLNAIGCDSTITLNLTITNVDISVTQNADTLTANATLADYQWINCNGNTPIIGETHQSFIATQNGDYAVIVTQNGCIDTSDCYTIIITGLSFVSSAATIVVYPNPTNDLITINFTGIADDKIRITLSNTLGQTLNEKRYIIWSKYFETQIDMSDYLHGMYFLSIRSKTINHVFKVLKQ